MCPQEPFLPLLLDDGSAHKADARLRMFPDRRRRRKASGIYSIYHRSKEKKNKKEERMAIDQRQS
jgi:hypothetical protein